MERKRGESSKISPFPPLPRHLPTIGMKSIINNDYRRNEPGGLWKLDQIHRNLNMFYKSMVRKIRKWANPPSNRPTDRWVIRKKRREEDVFVEPAGGQHPPARRGGVPLRPQRENFSGYHRFDAVLSGFSGRVVCSSSAYDQIF